MSDSLGPHGRQHARLSCSSLSPGVCSNSCPSSRWCHPTISSSITPLSSCPQSFSASGSFPVSQLFASSGKSIGASASAPVLPVSIQGWFPLGRYYRLKLRRSNAQSSSWLFSYLDTWGGLTRGWQRCQSSLDCQAVACGQTPERVIQPTVDFLSEKQTFVILSLWLGGCFSLQYTARSLQ